MSIALAPGQQCWGPTLRLPVRQAPPVVISPATYPRPARAEGTVQDGWTWTNERGGYWWRARALRPGECACGDACPCRPAPAKAAPKKEPLKIEQVENFGVDTSELGKRGRYTLSDRQGRRGVTRERAVEAVTAGLPDDKHLLRLLVVGAEADRKKVLADLEGHPALAPWRGKLVVQARPEDELTRSHGVPAGAPAILVQAPDGRVLGRNKDGAYRGPDALAKGLEAAAKRYDPTKDHDLWAPPGPAPGPLAPDAPARAWPWQAWALAAVGAAVVVLLWRPTRGNADAR